jgi:hypothetical protein
LGQRATPGRRQGNFDRPGIKTADCGENHELGFSAEKAGQSAHIAAQISGVSSMRAGKGGLIGELLCW